MIHSGSAPADGSVDPEIEELVRTGRKIHAIKRHRELYGSDLRGAKLAIDRLEARMNG